MSAVPNLYRASLRFVDSAERMDRIDFPNSRCFGSSCWTRTSDPVINSHRNNVVLAGRGVIGVLILYEVKDGNC